MAEPNQLYINRAGEAFPLPIPIRQFRGIIIVFSYNRLLKLLYKPTHAASLALVRILFGLLMLFDIPDERAGSYMDLRWGNPRDCHFPLFPQMYRLSLPWIGVMYGVMWMGALGITLGWKFKRSCLAFIVPYWYLLLLDKSFWNNHSYLFGLVSILFMGTCAGDYWSVDAWYKTEKKNHVPQWNYWILKFQFFLLYFYAGMKKTDTEWLDGYSMTNLGTHWVFKPFTIVLTPEQVDYLIVHWSGFLLDFSIGFFLLCRKTRPIAMIFCSLFHLMNTRLFSIGMFPYVCLVSMPIFCEPEWPLRLLKAISPSIDTTIDPDVIRNRPTRFERRHHRAVALLALHCFLQLFLPYSHFITKGYNNWTNGLYGYSWDMMVHSWDTTLVVVRVVDNNTGREHFLDPEAWTLNDRWNKHADMCVQYAQCLKKNLLIDLKKISHKSQITNYITSENISIYIDVWCSLNGRFQQRMYNPNYDLLKARWSPFKRVEWLLPLLTEYSGLRIRMKEIQDHVYSWSNYSDVLFIADFPGLYLDNYISTELINITLTVIEGEIYFEAENASMGHTLRKGDNIPIKSDLFHRVYTISKSPSCFMYTYTNSTKENLNEVKNRYIAHSPVPLLEDSEDRIQNIIKMFQLIMNSVVHILYGVPMFVRTK